MNGKHLLTSDEKLKHWGYGEWVEEPDLLEFDHLGLKCRVKRIFVKEWNGYLSLGHLCGYVCVPKENPYHGKSFDDFYSDIDGSIVDIHGGLTYGEFEGEEYWVGFDCGHLVDITPSLEAFKKTMKRLEYLNKLEKDIKKNYPNCALFNPTYKNINFVMEECKKLAEQIVKIGLPEGVN